MRVVEQLQLRRLQLRPRQRAPRLRPVLVRRLDFLPIEIVAGTHADVVEVRFPNGARMMVPCRDREVIRVVLSSLRQFSPWSKPVAEPAKIYSHSSPNPSKQYSPASNHRRYYPGRERLRIAIPGLPTKQGKFEADTPILSVYRAARMRTAKFNRRQQDT